MFAYNLPSSTTEYAKVAMFDLDDTLVLYTGKGKRNRAVWVLDYDRVELMYSNVPQKLKQLRDHGYLIVIITNQAGVQNNKITLEQMKTKMENVEKCMGVGMTFLCAPYYNIFRKPLIGSFDYLQQIISVALTRDNCFYCGDLIGRTFKSALPCIRIKRSWWIETDERCKLCQKLWYPHLPSQSLLPSYLPPSGSIVPLPSPYLWSQDNSCTK